MNISEYLHECIKAELKKHEEWTYEQTNTYRTCTLLLYRSMRAKEIVEGLGFVWSKSIPYILKKLVFVGILKHRFALYSFTPEGREGFIKLRGELDVKK